MTRSRDPRCTPRTAAQRAFALTLSAGLFAAIITWAVAANADELGGNPFVAMRAAAEEAADTEPDQTKFVRRGVPPAQTARSEALRAAVRNAIRDEVAHVVRPGTPGHSGNTPAAGNGNGGDNGKGGGNGNGSGNGNGNGASRKGLLQSAVSSAQQARRNLAVQEQRGKSGMPHPSPPGQSRAPILSTGAGR